MGTELNVLDNLQVAAPCSAAWEEMAGDDQVRFCDHCLLHVYNLSGMSRRQADALVRDTEGRLCVRFYRRRDGTVLTDNCPVGLRAARRRFLRMMAGMAGAAASVLGFLMPSLRPARREMVMGNMAIPVPVQAVPPGDGATVGKPVAQTATGDASPARPVGWAMGGPPAVLTMGEREVLIPSPRKHPRKRARR